MRNGWGWPCVILHRGDRRAEIYAVATGRDRGVVLIMERQGGATTRLVTLDVSQKTGGAELVDALVLLDFVSEDLASSAPATRAAAARAAGVCEIVQTVSRAFKRAARRRERIRA